MEVWQLYLLVSVDRIRELFEFLVAVGVIYILVWFICWVAWKFFFKHDTYYDGSPMNSKDTVKQVDGVFRAARIKLVSILTIVAILLLTLIPTRNELIFIYVTNKITTNEEIVGIPEKVLELANLKLDDLIEEVEGEVSDGESE